MIILIVRLCLYLSFSVLSAVLDIIVVSFIGEI